MDTDRADQPTRLRSIVGAALLADFASTRGLGLPEVLRDTGIRESDLNEPTAEITLGQEVALMRNVVRGVGDEPGQGLLAGLLCHPPSMGVLGFALMTCPTFGHAVDIATRYADLSFTAARLSTRRIGDEFWVLRDDQALPSDIRTFALERDLAAVATVQQDLLSTKLPVVRVEVTVAPHPIYEMFGAIFGVDDIRFDADTSYLVIPANTLDMPLPQANTATARYYEQQCADLMERRRSRVGVSGQVRKLLIRRGGVADQTHIAADLDISVRTLRRRLADEGTTFRELSNETVGMLAEELLVAGLTVEQVADRLGYSSVSAFGSAFRSWKGQSPGHFARINRGRATVRVGA
ncbi:AraC family transcriptional regulator [Nocardia otitidiscaviarum]|uniref:AraC family transcriptional regulator n=1 Tax=Nocardia otitidiscaviarum TaxID=1823 RepID=A0A516NHP2_9NOCA|nr:AraC family transcriptional regulator [Nocardia otitidiscaviarum]MBF6177487.1 AraC family transcriptional regulator [Nocardia otitidiscaviarum]MCP9620079.1 AraC family transcriptional regulator [Nocardia otitidiscaviarum]QDP78422.1 AraC family transcriptional regulator [Nocardia otitidiscaviarum]